METALNSIASIEVFCNGFRYKFAVILAGTQHEVLLAASLPVGYFT
jgi:hypothetical protein